MLKAIDGATAATGIHDGTGLLLDETVRLRCVTPVESYMDRLELLFLCSICSARCLRTPYFCLHIPVCLCPILYIWPPYTCISWRYACVLGACVNELVGMYKERLYRQAMSGLSMPVLRCEPASQQLLLC